MLAIVTNLLQYTAGKASSRGGRHWARWGPTYLLGVALPLIMADPTRHILQDAELWTEDPPFSSSMYRPHCAPHSGLHGIRCLSWVGWLFTIAFTYLGFGAMIASTLWAANLHGKVGRAWSDIRKAQRAKRAARAAQQPAAGDHGDHGNDEPLLGPGHQV